jgi:pimeloyl-ACP methyl ester carboxylesterase
MTGGADRRRVAGPAGSLSYLVWGEPGGLPPIVMLHPVNTAAAIWSDVARLVADRRAVYAVDYRGHGASAAAGRYRPADYAADALAVLEAEALPSAHVVGGSIGGAVSVELATLAPGRVRSICLFGAALRIGVSAGEFDDMAAGIRRLGVAGWFDRHGGEVVGSASVPGVVARLVDLASTGRDADTVIEAIRETFLVADARAAAAALAARVPLPVLVATGTEDPTCPPAMAREIATCFGTSAVLFDAIGHLPMIETPALTAALLRGFISTL